MNPITPNLNKFKVKKGANERADIIGQFHKAINKERQGTKYPPLPVTVIAVKVGHLKTIDLYHLLKICEGSESFSKVFFGSLK